MYPIGSILALAAQPIHASQCDPCRPATTARPVAKVKRRA